MYIHVSAYEHEYLHVHVESTHTRRDRAYLTACFWMYVHTCWREEGAWVTSRLSMMVYLGIARTFGCCGKVSGLLLLSSLQLWVQPSPAAWEIWGMKGRNFPEGHSG